MPSRIQFVRRLCAVLPYAVALQIALIALLAIAAAWVIDNALTNLASSGISIGFHFLGRSAHFPIAESILSYSPADTFRWALAVGLVNTIAVAALVCLISTALGIVIGLARRAKHPLAYGLSTLFVETLRNTPLVVQLLFWYAAATVGLPGGGNALRVGHIAYVSNRGLYLPEISVHGHTQRFLAVMTVGILFTAIAAAYSHRCRSRTGRSPRYGLIALAASILALTVSWQLDHLSIRSELPRQERFNFVGGTALTPEFAALLVGLVLYSSAFIGEIIRGGIGAVSRGQWEAGRAIGLSESRILRLVIIPQALRVIVPPLTSQYINVIKNSTLALVVGYPDFAFIIATMINQTGQAIEGTLILIGTFLCISIGASLLMNWYNRRIAIVER